MNFQEIYDADCRTFEVPFFADQYNELKKLPTDQQRIDYLQELAKHCEDWSQDETSVNSYLPMHIRYREKFKKVFFEYCDMWRKDRQSTVHYMDFCKMYISTMLMIFPIHEKDMTIVRVLLSLGADPRMKCCMGQTYLAFALLDQDFAYDFLSEMTNEKYNLIHFKIEESPYMWRSRRLADGYENQDKGEAVINMFNMLYITDSDNESEHDSGIDSDFDE